MFNKESLINDKQQTSGKRNLGLGVAVLAASAVLGCAFSQTSEAIVQQNLTIAEYIGLAPT